MVRKGYVEMQIERLTRMVSEMLRLRDSGDRESATTALDQSAQDVACVTSEKLTTLTERSLLSFITGTDGPDCGKCLQAYGISSTMAMFHADDGNEVDASRCRRRAVRYLAEALISSEFVGEKGYDQTLKVMLTDLPEMELPEETVDAIWQAFERSGRFADAEDYLYRWKEFQPVEWRDEATAFYQRMASIPEDRLENGGLSHEEVQSAILELEAN